MNVEHGTSPKHLSSDQKRGYLLYIYIYCIREYATYTPVIKHSNGKYPFSIGNTSSKGSFSIAMLVYQRVVIYRIMISHYTNPYKPTKNLMECHSPVPEMECHRCAECIRNIYTYMSHETNPPTFHYTGWLIGILIMAYYNPHITG